MAVGYVGFPTTRCHMAFVCREQRFRLSETHGQYNMVETENEWQNDNEASTSKL